MFYFKGEKTIQKIQKALPTPSGIDPEPQTLSQSSVASSNTVFSEDYCITSSQDSISSSPKKAPKVQKAPRKKPTKKYVPRYRSGGFAILVALFKADLEEGIDTMNKNDLIQRAQRYADEPLVPAHGTGYSSWSSMATLVKHNYVAIKKGRFSFYALTEEGREVASQLVSDNIENVEAPQICTGSDIVLKPGEFEIYLLIDSREQYSAGGNETRKTGILNEFTERDIKCKMVKLPVGDFAWMAREKIGRLSISNPRSNHLARKELLLDYVIERKRYDDLASSMKSGRWNEQKHRLLHSGIRHPMFLIEDFGSHRKQETMYNAMHQTIMDSMIIDGCVVKQTRNYADSVEFLVLMTKYLHSLYRNRTLTSCTKEQIISNMVDDNHFMTMNEYNLTADKITNFTAGEMFLKHLLKFKGISVPKAKAITDLHPTVSHLIEAYNSKQTPKECELMLSKIAYGNLERKIGPVISKKVYRFYSAILPASA